MAELICSADDPRWLDERRKGITATDITTILGLNPYQSPYGLWWEKTSPDMPAREDSDRLRLGRELEPYIVQRWADEHPDHAAPATSRNSLWRSSGRPWQLATLDSEVLELDTVRDRPERAGVLEVKSWADADKASWADAPPPRVRAQVLWQMDAMNVTSGHVGVLFLPSGEFRSYTIQHGDEIEHAHPGRCVACTDILLMLSAARDFLDRIDLNDPPDVDGSAATLAALRARFTRYPDKTVPIDVDLVDAWDEQKRQRDYHEARARDLEAKIRVKLGEASVGTVDDRPAVRRMVSEAKVKAHVRHQDYLKLILRRGDDESA